MPLTYSLTLIVFVAALMVLRVAVPSVPPAAVSRPLGKVDAIIALVGVLGLVVHCGAMFFPTAFGSIPGMSAYMAPVNALGAASIVLYTIPAVLTLIGLRRQHRVAVVALALSLLAVGITMYDGGPISSHLAAIATAIVILAMIGSLLVSRIGRSERSSLQTSTQ